MIYPNLTKIRSFVSVAEHASFRKAAENLHLSQPALSAHVRDLETLVGVSLFHRTTRSVQLTAEGSNFLARTKRALGELEAGLADLHDQASLQRGRVIAGCVPTIASRVLPTVLVAFTAKYPGITVRVVDVGARDLHQLVLNREVDFAIGPPPDHADDVVFKSILRDPFVCVCPRNHVLASRRKVRLATLASFPFLILASGNVRTVLQKAFADKGFPLRPAYEVVHHYTLGAMVEAGLGITALPSISISMLNHSLLRTIRIVDPEITREVGVLHRRDQLPTPAVEAFLSVLGAGFKRLETSGKPRFANHLGTRLRTP